MAARKSFIIDLGSDERVAVSLIRGDRPVVLEIHRMTRKEAAVAFVELTREQAIDVRASIDAILGEP